MVNFGEIFHSLVIKTLEQVHQFVILHGPKIIISLIILLIGWLCALLIKKIVAKLLKALGLNVVLEKTGLKSFLERGGITRDCSSVIGSVFYWIIMFSALIMVFNTLELETASQFIKQAIFYIPNIIVALLLLALGIFLSQFLGKFVEITSRLANIPIYRILGRMARYVVIGLAIMMSLGYLKVPTSIIVNYSAIIFGVVPLMLSLILLIGGRDIVSSVLSGRFLMREYKRGDRIEFDSISGEIVDIGPITTKIKSKAGEIIVPNSELARKTVKKLGV